MPEENSRIIKLEDIGINERIDSVLSKMPEEEFQELKENVAKTGELSSPLIVWKGTNILLGGFPLYRILQENPDVRYSVREIELHSWYDAFKWIYKNPFKHCRYMTHENRMLVIGSAYRARMDGVDSHGNQFVKKTGQYASTREMVAADFGISANAVRTAVEITTAVEEAETIHPGFWGAYRDGELKTGVRELKAITKASDEEKIEIVEAIFSNDEKQKARLCSKARDHKESSNRLNTDTLQDRAKKIVQDFQSSIQKTVTDFGSEINSGEGCHIFQDALSECETIISENRKEIKNKAVADASPDDDDFEDEPDDEHSLTSEPINILGDISEPINILGDISEPINILGDL